MHTKWIYFNVKCFIFIFYLLPAEFIFAADPGFIIQLDFRDQFSMEPHQNCTHDFLEVRDGAHGYSKLMENRTFCGHDFPPVLTSTGRYLWLRFKSDDNIEYTGFKAVYQFLPDPGRKFYLCILEQW